MRLLVLGLALALLASPGLADPPALHPELAEFEPFLGKTFRGDLTEPGTGRMSTDIQHWERVLNGQAIRIMHSVNDGEYGGESLLFWDGNASSLVYYYFTTAGFYTHGTMKIEGNEWSAHEFVEGAADGTTEVRSFGTLGEGGALHTRSEYLKDGAWQPGHSAVYHEDPRAEVKFK